MSRNRGHENRIEVFDGARILLGISGSIAAYKGVDLASQLTQLGAEVDVVLTEASEQFVKALTFQAVTGRRSYRQSDLWGEAGHILHVELARGADAYVVAPTTAHTLYKLAHGAADSLVALAYLAVECPVIVAPAMDAGMFEHPAVQENVSALRERGVHIAGPAEGRMASGLSGRGRMVEPEELVGHIRLVLGRRGPLQGLKVVVTAGPTREGIDPVRVLTNRSSGKQGYALAQAALDRGAEVVLVTGPTSLDAPVGARLVKADTAAEMHEAVLEACQDAAALIMAAAVSDFTPMAPAAQKLKKADGPPTIELQPTSDILKSVSQFRQDNGRPSMIIGFAAESENLVENAEHKLHEKGLDLIVANDISSEGSGFEVDMNQAVLLDDGGGVQELAPMTKTTLAERVLERVEDFFREQSM